MVGKVCFFFFVCFNLFTGRGAFRSGAFFGLGSYFPAAKPARSQVMSRRSDVLSKGGLVLAKRDGWKELNVASAF